MKLVSADVIHSFWIPALGGKTDLVPGQTNVTWIQADKPGVYRGQCTEYCGKQHAHMALTVVATKPDDFKAWWNAQLKGAPAPEDQVAAAGETTFIQKCGICHTVRGTRAQGIVGPNLSHLMERRTIAAGTLAEQCRQPGRLDFKSASRQAGQLHAAARISPAQLQRILAFLQTLK